MKIDCWCFTCIIGKSETDDPEESLLIPGETPPPSDDPIQIGPEGPTDTVNEAENNALPVNNEDIDAVFSESESKSSEVQSPTSPDPLLKNDKDHRIINLKIAVKIMAQSEVVKIFAVSATGVSDSLVDENILKDSDSVQETSSVVQLRTKLLPSETRGHSKKYDVTENILGALKFGNDCLHQITLEEFKQFSLRLRLYQILKQFHQRDKLLGEYILNFTNLGLSESETCTHNVIMQLHDPSSNDVEPPEVKSIMGSISSLDEGSARTTIRRSRTKLTKRLTIPEFSGNEAIQEDDKVQSQNPVQRQSSGRKSIISFHETTEKARQSVFNQLSQKTRERHSKVSELGNATEEMHNNARNFATVSRRLSERYERKAKKGF